jgi:hypothetical protein
MTDNDPEKPAPRDEALIGYESGSSAEDPDSTVGTGSVFAIGCTVLVFLILLGGIAFFVARQLE